MIFYRGKDIIRIMKKDKMKQGGIFIMDYVANPAQLITATLVGFVVLLFLSRKLRKSAKIVYNGLEIKNHITKERM